MRVCFKYKDRIIYAAVDRVDVCSVNEFQFTANIYGPGYSIFIKLYSGGSIVDLSLKKLFKEGFADLRQIETSYEVLSCQG